MYRCVLVVILACAACATPGAVQCPDGHICPDGFICRSYGCVLDDEIAACSGVVDGEPCSASRGNGACREGACQISICGNAIVEGAEACDDGNEVSRDGCNGTCTSTEMCGNGIVELEEACDCGMTDDGEDSPPCGTTVNGGTVCSEQCTQRRCGDGVIDPGEICDDGNSVAGDGCDFSCTSREICGNGILDYFAGEQCEDGNVRDRDGCDSTCLGEPLAWRLHAQDGSLQRYRHTGAWDIARRRLVVFGGSITTSGAFPSNETWEYDGATWTQQNVDNIPLVRYGAAMAYDPIRARVVMFGGAGENDGAFRDDTWEYDGVTWTRLTTATRPPARQYSAMAYDGDRKKLVLFGGHNGTWLNDVWELEGSTWTQVTTTSPPSARYGHAMVFDAALARLIVFGGVEADNSKDDDVAYALQGTTWTAIAPGSRPPPRVYPGLIYETTSGKVVLHGGFTGTGSLLTDTWVLDGSTWTPRSTNTPPTGRQQFLLAHDPVGGRTYLHGGTTGGTVLTDTWELDNATWSQRPALPLPSGRERPAIVYDSARGRSVMFGGFADNSTWWFDGRTWRNLAPSNPPAVHYEHAMAYDAARDVIVLFGGVGNSAPGSGGLYDSTYELVGSTWQLVSLATKPSARSGHAMAYDPVRRKTVLFGSANSLADSNETWVYDGAWTELTPATSPLGRYEPAMVYDSARGAIVMFGGVRGVTAELLNDTWIFDGTTWTELATTTRPPVRKGHAMVYDAARDRIVLFGGDANGVELDDLWELDGDVWREIPRSTFVQNATSRAQHAMVYDAAHNLTLVHSGIIVNGSIRRNDSWILELPTRRAGEVCTSASDYENDTKVGCADDECWHTCSPACSPNTASTSCPMTFARCGDGTCAPLETCRSCPMDCGTSTPACPTRCGDFFCDPGETCLGDC